MSVEITFEHDGSHGLVAEGSLIWEAARRLGSQLPTDCNGRGECDACGVVLDRGADLLSAMTAAELRILGTARLDQGQRLACQAKIEKPGVVVVRLAPVPESEAGKEKFKKRLRDLPFNQQVSAIIEIEAAAVSEALNTVRGVTRSFAGKLLNLMPDPSRKAPDRAAAHAKENAQGQTSSADTTNDA